MMAGAPAAIETFRDPAGSLRLEGDRVRRTVRPEYARAALDFLDSDLARQWVSQGRLIATKTIAGGSRDGELLLEHPRVFFPSYPWEWAPGAWIAAAELTLDLCESLVGEGLILKDATPLNVLFNGARPVFVDILSVEKRDPQSPLWMAYAQFVRTFLLPLAAYRYLGWPLATSLHKRDGYEPADLYPYLGVIDRWRQPLRSLVTLPYLIEKRQRKTRTASAPRTMPAGLVQAPEVAEAVLRRNLKRLRAMLEKLKPVEQESRWSDYPESAGHYTEEDHRLKQSFVRRALLEASPKHVLDLGANTGVYSRLAASMGASVVAWDTDLAATDRNWRQAFEEHRQVQPLIADASRPTPPVGWRNSESLALLDRAYRKFDCVMMLGLVHHLLVADQIPLEEVASLLRDLTTHWAIVEWVPATDPMFIELVRGRESLYGHLDEPAFVTATERHFRTVRKERLKNGRTLYLLGVA
jgi:SAM-dependent methyltransferase